MNLVGGYSKTTCTTYYYDIQSFLKRHDLEDEPPSRIKPSQIAEWINAPDAGRHGKQTKYSTKQKRLYALVSFFDWLKNIGAVKSNPAKVVGINTELLTHEQIERIPRNPYTSQELYKIEEYLKTNGPQYWLWMFYTALDTGLRLTDISTLRWANIVQDKFIVVWTKKAMARVVHQITPRMQAVMPPRGDSTWIWPELANRQGQSLSAEWARIMESLGIHGKSFHCLRHTYAQRMALNGISLDAIASSLGHKTPTTSTQYLH